MKINFVQYLFVIAVCSWGASFGSAFALQEPTEQLRPIIDKITEILAVNSTAKNIETNKVDRIMGVVKEGFDFEEMSKRVLGKKWRSLSTRQREEFVNLFTQLIKFAYVAKLDKYSNQRVEYGKQRIKENRAEVQTLLVDGDRKIPIAYIMSLKEEHWMVYDIVVEGVSLVRNYHEQFQEILRKEDIDGLTRQVEMKIAEFQKNTNADSNS